LDERMREAKENSPLPKEPETQKIESLLIDLTLEFIGPQIPRRFINPC
jgi:hypothetical protein